MYCYAKNQAKIIWKCSSFHNTNDSGGLITPLPRLYSTACALKLFNGERICASVVDMTESI